MAFAAYSLENTILVLSWGGAFAHFLKPHYALGLSRSPSLPHCRACSFPPPTNDKCPGGWARLELTEPLPKVLYDKNDFHGLISTLMSSL